MRLNLKRMMTAGLSALLSGAAPVAAADFAMLGQSLTPIGAERAGNKEGTIPAWDGGAPAAPAGWTPGTPRPDPYKADKRLFSIDAGNVDQHRDKLPEGQIHLLKNKPGYRLDVYPSRRSGT